ncbi:hypothetical protein BGZ54_003058 [Gamsiella multidivaricata]|nr:hypothetical protein BGZ54_003058 [Gamsiella multidivaricata]
MPFKPECQQLLSDLEQRIIPVILNDDNEGTEDAIAELKNQKNTRILFVGKRAAEANEIRHIESLWPRIAHAWGKVNAGCVCNCFAKVRILPHRYRIQEQLEGKYKGFEDIISHQNDFSVFNYLLMSDCKGPAEQIAQAADKFMAIEENGDPFIQLKEDDLTDEDEIDDEDEDKDDAD